MSDATVITSAAGALEIGPDPERPAGGFARIALRWAGPAPEAVTLAVQETFGERWLAPSAGDGSRDGSGRIAVGDPNWQPVGHGFGPYPVRASAGRIEIRIGPEIVNKIEGYTRLRLVLTPSGGGAALTAAATWPDDIIPLAGAQGLGGLQVTRPAAPAGAATPHMAGVEGSAPTAQTLTDPVILPEPALPEPGPAMLTLSEPRPSAASEALPEAPPRSGGAGLVVAGLAVLLLLLAGLAGWWWWQGQEAPPAEIVAPAGETAPTPEPAAEPLPEPAAEACAPATLAALPGGFAALRGALAGCRGQITPDALMRLVENAADGGDGAALLVLGRLYDPAVADPDYETGAGLALGDNPGLAAGYYDRAKAAGAPEAASALTSVCATLAEATDTLSQGAHDDHCP